MSERDDLIETMDALVCKCGHPYRSHDPEDGECDSPARLGLPLGKCRCECFRSPDPDRTTNDLRLDALLAHPEQLLHLLASLVWEKNCETCHDEQGAYVGTDQEEHTRWHREQDES